MKFIDLSHPICDDMSTYPSDPEVSIVRDKEIDTDRALLHKFTMGTHTGTHLDVPAHIIPDGKTLDQFPLSIFSGRVLKVDKNSYADLEQIEEKMDGIIFETGWYKNFNNPEIFFGPNRPAIPEKLIEKIKGMGVKIFGCDLPSVDTSGSKEKPVHHALLKMDIIVYEALNNLDQLAMLTPFQFYGFPLPLAGLDGSPVQAVGVLQKKLNKG